MRKLILYIAASLDGYIAKPGDDLSFLDKVQMAGEDYGYKNFISDVDTVILGRRTYDWVISQGIDFPHADKETYVITRRERDRQGKVTFFSGHLGELVQELKQKEGKNIFCDGGAEIVHALLKDKLLDEMIISWVPVLVGNGIRLFKDDRPEQNLELLFSRTYDSGLVQLHYKVLKS